MAGNPVSPDFSVAQVLAWARTKPADEAYDYGDNGDCALCQFLRATERTSTPHVEPYIGGLCDGFWSVGEEGDPNVYQPELEPALVGNGGPSSWTFGDLVDRLAAALPAEPVSDTWTKADAYLTEIEAVVA